MYCVVSAALWTDLPNVYSQFSASGYFADGHPAPTCDTNSIQQDAPRSITLRLSLLNSGAFGEQSSSISKLGEELLEWGTRTHGCPRGSGLGYATT